VGKFIWLFKALIILGLAGVIFGSSGWFAYQLFIKPNQIPPEELAMGAPTPPPDPSLPAFQKAMDLKKQGKLVEARTAFENLLQDFPYTTKMAEVKEALGKVNADIFFSAVPAPEKIRYEIRPGDALVKIERKLKTTRELIMRSNNLDDPTRLRIGTVLYVSQPEFSVVVDRKAHSVTLLNHYKFFKQYNSKSWTAPAPKKGKEKVAITCKVTEKIAWKNGARVAFGSKEYMDSDRWVELSVKGFTFYTEGGQKPAAGIGFAPEDMEELSTLLSKNVPVTIQ
jgi:LysM repeat protein